MEQITILSAILVEFSPWLLDDGPSANSWRMSAVEGFNMTTRLDGNIAFSMCIGIACTSASLSSQAATDLIQSWFLGYPDAQAQAFSALKIQAEPTEQINSTDKESRRVWTLFEPGRFISIVLAKTTFVSVDRMLDGFFRLTIVSAHVRIPLLLCESAAGSLLEAWRGQKPSILQRL